MEPSPKFCYPIAHKARFAFTWRKVLHGSVTQRCDTEEAKNKRWGKQQTAIEYSIMTPEPLKRASFKTTRCSRTRCLRLPCASTVLWTTLLLLALGAGLWVTPHQQATLRKATLRKQRLCPDSMEAFALRRHRKPRSRRHRSRWATPFGMAPQAFKDYVRACARARVNPHRISQTIGNDPRSAGYHRRDGVVVQNRRKVVYCAAVDVDIAGLRAGQIRRLCVSLAREGFAAFYRRGGAWEGDEHIHAVYGAVRMKPQLQEQVRQFLRERRENGFRRLWWARKFRRRNGS